LQPLYSLEKLIEWKLDSASEVQTFYIALYSLEKSIEWKPIIRRMLLLYVFSLYSLEKLIEWKRGSKIIIFGRF